jgi:hypothetical protein
MKSIAKVLVLGVAAALSCGALAQNKPADPPPALSGIADTKENFADQATAIRQQMKSGGRWEFVSGDERTTVEKRLDEITALLGNASTAGELQPKDKAAVLTAQEEVNAILSKKDGRRLICQSVAPTGSHRKQMQCRSYAERERERRDAADSLRDTSRSAQGLNASAPIR